MTRRDLRLAVARLLNDCIVGAAASGTSSALLVDANRIEPDDHWRGHYVYRVASQAEAVVSASSQSDTSLSLAQPLAGLQAGDEYELHRISVGEYNAALAQAQGEVSAEVHVPAEPSTAYAMAEELDLSSLGWRLLARVELDRGWGWERVSPRIYRTDKLGKLYVARDYAEAYAGLPLRLHGLRAPASLDADGSVCELPRANYLVYRAAKLLLLNAPDRFDAGERAKLAAIWEQEALRERMLTSTLLPPNAKPLM